MKYQEAQKIQIVDVLSRLGLKPVTQRNDTRNGLQYIYHSPFRSDNNPSFVVTLSKNLFYDNGTGEGGNVKNLFCLLSGSSADDIKSGLAYADRMFGSIEEYKPIPNTPKVKKSKPTFIVDSENKITFYPLKKYLAERKIPLEIAERYCAEIHFTNTKTNKQYKAIGFKAGQCWELRNKSFKCSVGTPKTISVIKKDNTVVEVYTGFFDFLSSLVVFNPNRTNTVIVLNSDRMINPLIKYLDENNTQTIHLFKDNDTSGNEIINKLSEAIEIKIHDRSPLYSSYNDLNEYLVKTS